MININNISFTYTNKDRKREVLKNINLKIRKGEFVSILGRSGSGKTTLVNILAGYIQSYSGTIYINEDVVVKPGKNRIVVNQQSDIFEWMTVSENMNLVCKRKNITNKFLKIVDLERYKNDFPRELSGGMKKKLSLARALTVEPELLILDEPFASLDHYSKDDLHLSLDKIFSLTRKTTILVTHDVDEAIFLSDRVVVIGKKPARVIGNYSVNFPHPRKLGIKNTKKFATLRNMIKKMYL